MIEFLIVPIVFGLAFMLLALNKLIGRDKELHTCSTGSKQGGCATCAGDEFKTFKDKSDPGFENVAKLGNPNRRRPFSDKFDFRPERYN